MSARRLDGRREADRLLHRLAGRVRRARRPLTMATILVGTRYDSALYVRLKRQAAARVGIKTEYHHLPTKTSQAALERLIRRLNQRRSITGILLQLPLPSRLNADAAVAVMDPRKDVDGFHPQNTIVVPPPVAAVLHLIKVAKPKRSATVFILAQPSVFTMRLTQELNRLGHIVIGQKSRVSKIASLKRADIIVTALGTGPQLQAKHIKRGAIIIDVGIRQRGKKTVGDVDQSCWQVAKAISPVPGGVGPLTVACVLQNTFNISKK